MRKRSGAEIRRLVASSAPPATGAIPPSAHHLHQYLNLVAALGANPAPLAPHLAVTDAELAAFRGTHLSSAPPDLRWFGLNPHAEYGPAKRWPQERFVEAALALHRQTGCGWLVFGGPKDVAPATEIWAALQRGGVAHAVNLAGRTTLRDLCAALKLCRVLLTNDSGPMHVAAAVGTPVAALFGSTSPELTGPGFVADRRHAILQSRTVCSPCFLRACPIDFRCMNGITVEHAVSAVLFLLR